MDYRVTKRNWRKIEGRRGNRILFILKDQSSPKFDKVSELSNRKQKIRAREDNGKGEKGKGVGQL